MEPRGVIADWDGDTLTLWASTQTPSMLRTALAGALGLTQSRVRVIVPDVGGGFGLKVHVFPEDVAVAAAARRLRRPVKWVEERQENLGATVHAREGRVTVDVAADRTGRVRGLRARVISDGGAYHIYPLTAALEPLGAASILPGPYRIEAYAWDALAVRTHKPPLGAYRGVGMTMGAFVMERVMDLVAERVGLDPAEVRRQNLIPADAYPWTSPTGYVYDSGDYPRALEHALELADYATLRREQAAARAQGRLVGVGLACYTEYTGMGAEGFRRRGLTDLPGVEAATLTMDADGSVRCATSFPSQGQGHATTIAQVVADRLGIALQCVRVVPSDTSIAPAGSGTFASRGAVSIGGTVAVAADRCASGCARWPPSSSRRRRPISSSPTAALTCAAFPSAASRWPSWRGWRPFRRAADCQPASSRASRPRCPSILPGRPSPAPCTWPWWRSIARRDGWSCGATWWWRTADAS